MRYTKTERNWGFRFESVGLGYVLHLGVNLKDKAVRFCILGFGFHAGRIPHKVARRSVALKIDVTK